MISRRQIISRSAGPIFAVFTSNESVLGVDDRYEPLFSISQGTLPWQPIKLGKSVFSGTNLLCRAAIRKRIAISQCRFQKIR